MAKEMDEGDSFALSTEALGSTEQRRCMNCWNFAKLAGVPIACVGPAGVPQLAWFVSS
jgi:hypothetical protein